MKNTARLSTTLLFCTLTSCAIMPTQPEPSQAPELHRIEKNPVGAQSAEAAVQWMANAPSLVFRQSWEPVNEPGFQPAIVRFGIHQDFLVGVAILQDGTIGNRATQFNARTWELGDVFEFFITDPAGRPYYEFHVTPENHIMQMRWPAAGTLQREAEAGTLDHSRYFLSDPILASRTWTDPAAGHWVVAFALPLQSIGAGITDRPERIQLSFCRYDGDKADSPVVYSSTTDLPFAGFHEIEFWPLYRIPSRN